MISATVISLWQAKVARIAQARAETQTALAIKSEALAKTNEALAASEAKRANKAATFLTELLDRVSDEIDHGRNPEALRLALADSERRIAALGADVDLQLQLLNRVADIYNHIGETKQLIPLLKAYADTTATKHGATTEEAFKAELNYLKMVSDHGNRVTVPPLIEALRGRVEAAGQRASRTWFDVQSALIRAHCKLKQPGAAAAVAAAEACLSEPTKLKPSSRTRINLTLTCVPAFEIAGDHARVDALLTECETHNRVAADSSIAQKILNARVHLCWSQKDFAGGAVALRKIVAALKAQHGEQGLEVCDKLLELVEYEIDANELAIAIGHAQEAVAIGRAHQRGRDELARALNLLAKAEGTDRRYDEAIKHAEEARVIATGVGKPSTMQLCVQNLAVLHEDAGYLEEAATFYLLHHANYKEVLEVMEEVCAIRMRQGRLDEAMSLAQELWSRLKSEPESKHEAPFAAEIANQCLAAWKATRTAKPDAPEPANLTEWRAASAAAEPPENPFGRKLRQQR
jgi:hypothetical protein